MGQLLILPFHKDGQMNPVLTREADYVAWRVRMKAQRYRPVAEWAKEPEDNPGAKPAIWMQVAERDAVVDVWNQN